MTEDELYDHLIDYDNSPFTIADLIELSGLSFKVVGEISLEVENDVGSNNYDAMEGYYM